MSAARESAKSSTIADVAREAGVSVATAARALGRYGSVSTASRASVDAAAMRLGYRRNKIATSMKTGRTHLLGFVAAGIEDPFFSNALRGVADVARREGFEVLIANSDEDLQLERAAVNVLDELRVEGMIVAPVTARTASHLEAVMGRGTPIVFFDRKTGNTMADAVLLDNVSAGRMATEHLVRMGHRRIGLITSGLVGRHPLRQLDEASLDPNSAPTTVARGVGYLSVLRSAGISAEEGLIGNSPVGSEGAAAAAREVLRQSHPTALLAVDGITSLGAFRAIQESGLRFPQDVSLLGFDDLDWMTIVRPTVSTVAQSPYEIGATATRRLIARLAGELSPPQLLLLAAELMDRESVMPGPYIGTRRAPSA